MNRWLAVGLVSAVFGSISAGCSSSTAPATVTSFCQAKAQAECPPVVGLCVTLSELTCESAVEAQCEQDAANAENAKRQFTPGNVYACLSALSSAFGQVKVSSPILPWTTLNGSNGTTAAAAGSPNDLCEKVFAGTLQQDAPCTSSYECAGGNVCGSNFTCGPEADKTLGQGCADPGDVCTGNTVCTLQGTVSVCTAGAQVDQACSATTPCATNAECVAGKCVALASAGQHCSTNADCDPSTAANGMSYGFCDAAGTGVCTYGYTFGTSAVDCSAFSATSTGGSNPGSGSAGGSGSGSGSSSGSGSGSSSGSSTGSGSGS